MNTAKQTKKTKIPPPGRKLSVQQAEERVNKRFSKALARLAK